MPATSRPESPDAEPLLLVAEMMEADRAAIAAGVSGITLMDNAGRAVAEAVQARWSPRRVLVLCGPGNNGGDGFVAARCLAAAGWPVSLALTGSPDRLSGDAAWAAGTWSGPVLPADAALMSDTDLIIDGLFGAGLRRPLDGGAAMLVQAVNRSGCPVIAIDLPSGIQGDTGIVLGSAIQATLTVTFFRRKPGHLLLPGRLHCGELLVADIGIPPSVLTAIRPRCFANTPSLWSGRFPWPSAAAHKYSRGHAVIAGGSLMTGAARLAAKAAQRAGAGLVTLAVPPERFDLYALALPAALIHPVSDDAGFAALLTDPRRNAVLLGPGAGVGPALCLQVRQALDAGKAGVLDADVFSSFAGHRSALLPGLNQRWLLTPHDGEFARLFPEISGSRLERARAAARLTGAAVLLKGADTVIAHPDGQAAINSNAPADLATAGSGDVLAGLAVGLIAQGLDGFTAGCIAAWLHGELGNSLGPGLIADDLPDALPAVLRRLKALCSS
jgi:ADP-dependent NAD(P)H-hydrate dehydratase / NAD(P)H-hydrate epimerase